MATAPHDGVGFSDHEREAMRARSRELAAEQRATKKREEGERDVLEAISQMAGTDRMLAEKVHGLVTQVLPDLWPKTWYGMPAYARGGQVVCFFQAAQKFGARYATLGFNDSAVLDDGLLWPTAFALVGWDPQVEGRLVALLEKSRG